MGIMYEKRPLKRPRLGPPDVYPQEPRQKEDELTSANVKHGFTTAPQSSDEFGTARNFNHSAFATKIGQFFSGILSKKEELNTLPDCGKKRQQVNPKDNFWPATARTKPQIEAWFKDLAGSKPLSVLAKKAPNFNKKEEIFITLTEYQVAMPRAAWFIKLSSAYTVAVSEAKIKKRQHPDPTTEWTTTLIKFLKDQIPKLAEYYQSGLGNISDKTPPSQSGQGTPSHNISGHLPGSSTPNSTASNSMHSPGSSSLLGSSTPGPESTDWRQALKQWNYCCRLAKYLLDEGLLDRHDFLSWIIELLDKRTLDDGLLRLFLPLALQYMCEFVCCEGLSRRLATTCAKKSAAICSVLSETTLRTLNQPAVFKNDRNADINCEPLSPVETNVDVKPNINQIKRSATPADQNHGTPNPNHSLGTPNPNHSLGTPNPMGTPNPSQPLEQVKEENESPTRDTKTTLNTVITASLNPVQVGFGEILNCSFHRDVIIQLGTILQIICIECPTAMIWSGCGSALQGSPLDILPLPPSALPMPHMDSEITEEHKRLVYEAEQEISARSKKAESKWCTDKWQTSSQARVLAVLEALDRHCFDRVDPNNNLDTLYKEVFANCTSPNKDGIQDPKDPEYVCSYAVVRVLCEWAVCGARWGEHRAMAAAALLDRRQHHHHHHEHQGSDDKESISSATGLYNGPPIFQNLLLRFLDNDAPVLDESSNAPPGNRQQFANLVHLFGELIRRDVFSHDAYMCTLISRGDLISPTEPIVSSGSGNHTVAQPVNSAGTNHNMDDDIFAGIDLKPKMEENVRMDLDDSKIDDDLDKLLQHIKEDQQNSMDAPDSPKDPGEPSHSVNSPMMGAGGMSIPGMQTIGMGPMSVPGIRPTSSNGSNTSGTVSRHYHYTMHFPLPPTEPEHTPHDANQRHILLYGVGRQRDDAKHAVKKMTKEICKLFSKKFSIDVAEGGKIKKHSRSEFNFEAVTQKFQSMSMYEQGAVSWAVGGAVCEALAAYAAGATTYLPQPEHVAFALDLMEIALNVHGLIETCIQILKELSEVEAALTTRNAPSSGLAAPRAYTSALALYTVGALRRYHSCLLLCVEQTSAVFEQLCRLVKCVVNPGDCGSAERCVLAQLHDLYKAAAHLFHAPHADTFANAYPKIKQALYSPLTPTPSNFQYNPQFLSEFFTNPRKGKIEISWARQVAESPANRYSFVCSAMLAVCREVDNDRVNEIGVLCAEMTAWCSGLAAEWLGALVALCGAQHYPPNAAHAPPLYPDLLNHRDLHDAAAHDALAVFTSILVARHCFSLEDFVRHAALPSLVKACNASNHPSAPSPDAGARLTCHLLLRLFKTVDTPQPGLYSVSTSPGPGGSGAGVRLSCDRHLLAAAHKNIGVAPVLATLKAILMVGDSTARESGKPSGKKSSELSHILGTSDTVPSDAQLDLLSMVETDMNGGHKTPRGNGGVGSTLLDSSQSLSSLARRVLVEICSEEWVLQKCLQNPDELYQPDMLLDPVLTPRQAQRLLHMICYPDSASHTHPDLDQKTMITRLLENLEQWSLRMSWLDLQLMFKQFQSGSSELSAWLDTVARAVINVFQQPAPPPPDKDRMGTERGVVSTSKWSQSVWLVAPLVAKLPPAVQGRVLKQAGQILESGWGAGCSGNCSGGGGGSGSHRDCKSHQSPSYKGSAGGGGGGKRGVGSAACGGSCACAASALRLANEPLLSLVLTCLRHQDDQKESLLSSIHAQLQHYLNHARDHERSACGDTWQEEAAPEALLLRFSLAGGMFDAIRRSYQLTSDWAVLLTQLVAHQVIDAYNNSLCRSNLFTTLIDMLATLIHSTLAEGGDDNNRKHYQNLMKKLKKEIGDRHGPSVQAVKQLLPLSKNTVEVIACEKITSFDSDKKQGLRLTDKLAVSSWELVEGGRNPAPLSWTLFAATKIERKPLTYENSHRLLKYHTHSLVKPLSYYLEPLPLPPEDLDNNDSKQDNGSLDSSPTGSGKGRKMSCKMNKMKKSKPTTPTNGVGGAMGSGMATQQQPQFMPQQQQWFPHGQNYYNPSAGVNPRGVVPPTNAQGASKQALSNMLRNRFPFSQMTQMQQSSGYPGAPQPRGPFPRQAMRQMQPNQMGQMQPNQMNPMSGMGGMGPMGQMGGVQMGPGQMSAGQMGGGQMGSGQMGGAQMASGQMAGGQMSSSQMGGMGGQMFGGQYAGMQQSYGGYGQQMMQGGQQQMMNQGMSQGVNQMSQQVNPMSQGVNSIGQNVGQMNQGVGQSAQMPQSMGQMSQGMGQMSQSMGQMSQMAQGGGMGMNSQGGSMGPQGGNGMGGFPGQQSFQQNMMSGRASQEAYLAQQRQNARPQYIQQAPNVTMGGMGGPAPPYRGMQPQQNAQYQQQMTQQQRMRQQMLAMQQQQQQQQQQQGPLVQHLQRQQYQQPYQ
ncbi:unnamed protein product [Pieris brassicae]|uniref:Mediator complex subunit Med12 domain-containing protein n=1 Tax=Pieris brassicae TaxID=7116 RepID=A0A9P0TAN6_PIEBR|nr:unnamed protein product [Pieris brassicae]